MDLVAGHLRPLQQPGQHTARFARAGFIGGEHGFAVQQIHAAHLGGVALVAVGIVQGFAHHLIAAAHPQHRHPQPGQAQNGCLQPAFPQPKQIGGGAFGAGQDHKIRLAQLGRCLHIAHRKRRVGGQRRKIREIADMRQAHHGNIHCAAAASALQAGSQRILIVHIHLEHGHHACHRNARKLLQLGKAGLQKAHIAAEFIDDQPFYPLPFAGCQQCRGAVQLGKHAAAVNISGQQHRGIHQFGKAHVHNIILPQIDLGRAARALDHDHIVFGGKAFIGGQYFGDQLLFIGKIFLGAHLRPDLAVHDHLTARIAAGLEQHRVHAHIRLDAGGLGLHILRPAHFQPILRYGAVQRHVLAFKRCSTQAVLCKNAAQRRAQKAFARPRHGALHHDASGFFCHRPSPFLLLWIFVLPLQHLCQRCQQGIVFGPGAHRGAIPPRAKAGIVFAAADRHPQRLQPL